MGLGELTNIFIGMCLVFASVALLVSTVTEGLASLLKLRSSTLLDGLKSMLNAQTPSMLRRLLPPIRTNLAAPIANGMTGANLLRGLLDHASINPLGPGNNPQKSADRAPSYIDPAHFAAALIDVLCPSSPGGIRPSLSAAIAGIQDNQLKQLLQGIYDRSDGDLQKIHRDVASWFDASMARVGGDYKRYIQLWNFLIGLGVAALFNIDAIAIVHALLSNPALTASAQFAVTEYKSLPDVPSLANYGLPIGWTAAAMAPFADVQGPWPHVALVVTKLLGWLIMAIASLFGAPFWFDTLQRFVQLRGTGDKPATPVQPPAPAQPAAVAQLSVSTEAAPAQAG
jgi:hypothetical protein